MAQLSYTNRKARPTKGVTGNRIELNTDRGLKTVTIICNTKFERESEGVVV